MQQSCVLCTDRDDGESLPEQSSTSCLSEDDRGVRWHLEIAISPLHPVFWFSIHCKYKNAVPWSGEANGTWGTCWSWPAVGKAVADWTDSLTMVHLILLLVHGVDAGSGPELQERLEQQPPQVHCKMGKQLRWGVVQVTSKQTRSEILHFGSDPSELENPASFADTHAAKQSLSSSVMVSIFGKREPTMRVNSAQTQDRLVSRSTAAAAHVNENLVSSPQFSDQQKTNLARRPSWTAS